MKNLPLRLVLITGLALAMAACGDDDESGSSDNNGNSANNSSTSDNNGNSENNSGGSTDNGGSLSFEEFAAQYGDLDCQWSQACEPEDFASDGYSSLEECQADRPTAQELLDDGCTYNASSAQACLDALAAAVDCSESSLEAVEDACFVALDCIDWFQCGGGELMAPGNVCDGTADCPDGSDEANCGG